MFTDKKAINPALNPAPFNIEIKPELPRWITLILILISISLSKTGFAALDCSGTVPIYEIQGRGHISPYVGQAVETCGVVTAVGFNFYFVQDAAGDGDDSTSDGLYIFSSGDKPSVGDEVRLAGEVAEFIPGGGATGNLSITQMAFPTIVEAEPAELLPMAVSLSSSGRTPPAEVVISTDELPVNLQIAEQDEANNFDPSEDAIDFYESLEGMLVAVPDAVAVSGIRQFGAFSAEVFTLAENGAGATPVDGRTSRGGIRLQPDPDNLGDQNPERIQVQFDGTIYQGDQYPYIQVGDSLGTVTGVIGYSFGNFEVFAIDALSPGRSDTTAEVAPSSQSSELTVASYNVFNLSAVEADDAQREKVADQIVNHLHSPDIIALQEIQDNNGDIGDCSGDDISACAGVLDADETLAKLTEAIAAAGGPNYTAFNVNPLIETDDTNRDEPDAFGGAALSNIRNAYLYNANRVDLLSFVGLTREELASRGVTASTAFDASRDPLEARFDFNGNTVTVLNNHFESRFGSTPIFGGPQPFVQAAEDAREAQSLAMHQLVKRYLDNDSAANILVLGDLNTFEFTNDLDDILTSAEGETILTRIGDSTSSADEYSFIFDGNSQALDHIYATSGLIDNASLNYVHVNVDFPRRLEDVVASDHDPLLATFGFDSGSQDDTLNLRGETYSSSAIELFWERLPSAVRYELTLPGDVLTTDGTSQFFDGLQPSTNYYYAIQAIDGSGAVIATDSLTITTNGGAPSDSAGLLSELSGSVYSSSALELFWAADAAAANGDLKFEVYRDGALVSETDGRSFFDSNLMPGTSYLYTVDYVANGVALDSASLTLQTRGGSTPEKLLELTGEVYSSSAIELFWSSDNANTVMYRIRRDGVNLDTRDAKSFFDSGLEAGTTYEYSVSPIDSAGIVGTPVAVTLTTRE